MAEYPWIKSYPAGMRWDAEIPTMPVSRILDDTVANGPAIRPSTYRDNRRRTHRLAWD